MWEPVDINVKALLKYHTYMTLCFMLIKIMLSKKKLSVLSHILSVHISILLKRRPEAWFSYMKNVAIVKPKLSIEILDFVCIDNRIHEVHWGEEEKNYLLSRHCQQAECVRQSNRTVVRFFTIIVSRVKKKSIH